MGRGLASLWPKLWVWKLAPGCQLQSELIINASMVLHHTRTEFRPSWIKALGFFKELNKYNSVLTNLIFTSPAISTLRPWNVNSIVFLRKNNMLYLLVDISRERNSQFEQSNTTILNCSHHTQTILHFKGFPIYSLLVFESLAFKIIQTSVICRKFITNLTSVHLYFFFVQHVHLHRICLSCCFVSSNQLEWQC